MRSEEALKELWNKISLFWEEATDQRRQYFLSLTDLCRSTRSKVALEFLSECEDLCNNRLGNIINREWKDWVYSSDSLVHILRGNMYGDEVVSIAQQLQERLRFLLEDYVTITKAAPYGPFTDNYCMETHRQVSRLTDELEYTTKELYTKLHREIEWIGEDISILAYGVLSLIEDVFGVVLLVTYSMQTLLKTKETYIGQRPVKPVTNERQYRVSFNPVTGYVELQLNQDIKSFTVPDCNAHEIAIKTLETLLALEREY